MNLGWHNRGTDSRGTPVTRLDAPLLTREIVRRALEEDMPWGDVTTDSIIPPDAVASGQFIVKEMGVVCGLPVAQLVFEELDRHVYFRALVEEGAPVGPGTVIACLEGSARVMLAGERTALNLLQRMSGIATATRRYVEAVRGTGATIIDTRKTAPGLRVLDKYAVRQGGGSNHRHSLSDAVLIKDNHIVTLSQTGRPLAAALQALRTTIPHTVVVEVEVDRLDQIEEVLRGGANILLLDNMDPPTLQRAVEIVAGRAITEASGGITLETVRSVAESGVDLISVGALTHSVRALDISLDITVEAD